MRTLQDIIGMYKDGLINDQLLTPLSVFLQKSQLLELNITEDHPYNILSYNRKNLITVLKNHVDQGFEFALQHKGLASELMFKAVKTLNWALEEGLDNFEYELFGLPLFKATAEKYGFANPINGFVGNESGFGDNWD